MPYTTYTIVSDGTENSTFPVSFTIPFMSREHVRVRVNEEEAGGSPSYRSLSWVTDTLVKLGGAPVVSGDSVVFTNTPSITKPAHDFIKGAGITAAKLDQNQLQALTLAGMVLDGRFDTPFEQGIDMGSHKITGLKTPTKDSDAVTKAYVDAEFANARAAESHASTAAGHASAASGSSSAAADSAKNAKTSEDSAAASATAAKASENAAAASATAAKASETAAGTSEKNAKASETAAAVTQSNVSSLESSARSSSTSASGSASTATTKALEAANSATASANSATQSAASATKSANSASEADTSAKLAASSAATAAGGKLKVSSNDSTLRYLGAALVAGAAIKLAELNDGGDETLSVDVSDNYTDERTATMIALME